MALIGNDADTLFHGLSTFWRRFFRDVNDIKALYQGTEILLGQVYLNFLSDVLNTSVVEAPLFRKEYYRLITVREDQLVFREHGENVDIPPLPSFYGNPGFDRYVLTEDTVYNSIPRLQDLTFSPTTSLEEGTDYRVAGKEIQFKVDPTNPVAPGYAHRRVAIGIGGKFTSATVSDWTAAGVQKGDTLYFSPSIDLGTPPPPNQASPGFAAWLALRDSAYKATIIHLKGDTLSVSSETPFPTFPEGTVPTGFSWRIERLRDDGIYNTTLPLAPSANPSFPPFTDGQIDYTKTLEVSEIAMWAVDSQVDDLTLYKTYGYFFTNEQTSSEAYRALIRGLMQLYILGPAMARLESALNLTAGLETVREEGEILQEYDSGILATGLTGEILLGDIFQTATAAFDNSSVGGYIKIKQADYANNIGTFNIVKYISPTQVQLKPYTLFTPNAGLEWSYTRSNAQAVRTDKNVYLYPLDTPVRADVKDSGNYGVLTFQAFEALTTAIRVTDYVQDPEWWHTITIPQEILPKWSTTQRVVTPQLYPSVIGIIGNAAIGDPEFYVGSTFLYDDPVSGPQIFTPTPPQPAYHRKAAFVLMDRFLKMHMFAVLVDQSVALTGLLVNDLQKILKEVKPVHTALYFRPLTTFTDVVNVTDAITFKSAVKFTSDTVGIIDNQYTIGSTWLIGDTWSFAGAVGGAVNTNPMVGGMSVCIGGSDPSVQPADPTNIPPGSPPDLNWMDRALYVYMHP